MSVPLRRRPVEGRLVLTGDPISLEVSVDEQPVAIVEELSAEVRSSRPIAVEPPVDHVALALASSSALPPPSLLRGGEDVGT
jgi:hypothetical protein